MRASRSRVRVTAASVGSAECGLAVCGSAEPGAAVRSAPLARSVGRSSSASTVSGSRLSWAIDRPATVTARAAGVRPLPSHSGHGPDSTNRSARSR